MLVLQMSPAKSVPVSSATFLAMRSAWRFICSSCASRPMMRSFSRLGVVSEGLDDVGAGMDEIAMQLLGRPRDVEHRLGNEGAGL